MGQFSVDIVRFIRKVEHQQDMITRKIALEVFTRVQRKTPVDSGALRQSWTVALNAFPTQYNGANEAIAAAKYGNTLYIATDKPYAPMVEYGLYPNSKKLTGKTINGFSKQAPQGMVRITVSEVSAWINRYRGKIV